MEVQSLYVTKFLNIKYFNEKILYCMNKEYISNYFKRTAVHSMYGRQFIVHVVRLTTGP